MVDDLVGAEPEGQAVMVNGLDLRRPSTDNKYQALGIGNSPGVEDGRRNNGRGSIDRGPHHQLERLKSVSSLWDEGPGPRTPSHGQTNQVSPQPSAGRSHAHSRVGSATSINSRSSWHDPHSISSFAPTPPYSHSGPRGIPDRLNNGFMNTATLDYDTGLKSPLLFGAGGGPWSSVPRRNPNGQTPPNGQGG